MPADDIGARSAASPPAPDALPDSRAELKRWNARLSALRWLLAAWETPVLPEYVGFNVTTRCNLSCPHCPSHGTPEAKRAHNDRHTDMLPEAFRRLAAELLPAADMFSLTLTGEPLALPGLEDWLQAARAHGARLHLVTNGTLLTPRRIALLLPLCGVLQVSTDGASRRVFETLRRGASFAAFAHNARLLSRTLELMPGPQRPRLGLTCVGMGSNVEEWPELVRLAHALGYAWLQIGSLVAHFDEHEHELLGRHQARVNHYRAEALALGQELGVLVEIQRPTYSGVVPDAAAPAPGLIVPTRAPAEPSPRETPLFDSAAVELQVRECLALMREETAHPPVGTDDLEGCVRDLRRRHADLVGRCAAKLAELALRPDQGVWHCVHLRQRLHVRFDGSVFACPVAGLASLGSLAGESPRGLWNGPALTALRSRLGSDDPPAVCLGCPQRRQVRAGDLLAQAGVSVAGR